MLIRPTHEGEIKIQNLNSQKHFSLKSVNLKLAKLEKKQEYALQKQCNVANLNIKIMVKNVNSQNEVSYGSLF